MRNAYLPDLNVLVAAHIDNHRHHQAAYSWLASTPHFATCSLTESGLLRLLSNKQLVPDGSVADALDALRRLRSLQSHEFVPDAATLANPLIDTSRITGYRQVPDFHLLNLAAWRGAVLVTFDTGIAQACSPSDRKHLLTLPI